MGTEPRRYFFITSLPRSRSAWIATYLSYGSVSCLHDGFRGLTDPKQIKDRLDATCAKSAGNCDPSILMFQDQILEQFPDAKYVYIDRDPRECEASWAKLGGTGIRRDAVKAVDFLRKRLDTLVVPYDELDDRIDDIGCFVTDGNWKCPLWRNELLVVNNIQQDMDKVGVSVDMNTVKTLLSHARL